MSPGRACRGTPVLRSRTVSSRRIRAIFVRHGRRARVGIVRDRQAEHGTAEAIAPADVHREIDPTPCR